MSSHLLTIGSCRFAGRRRARRQRHSSKVRLRTSRRVVIDYSKVWKGKKLARGPAWPDDHPFV